MKPKSNRRWFYLVRYDEQHGVYELGPYVNGPGVELLRDVLEQLNKIVQLEVKESA